MRDRAANMLRGGVARTCRALLVVCLAVAGFCSLAVCSYAQENPLNNVETPAPPPKPKTPEEMKPVIEGGDVAKEATSHRDARIRVTVNLVQVPLTVTDPMNRLVTGLEKENFFLYDNNIGQSIKVLLEPGRAADDWGYFRFERKHVVEVRSRAQSADRVSADFNESEDEFFVVGFNDPVASIIVDYTSDPDDVEARMVMLKPENRTALIDAVYLGIDHLRQARYERKALLVISDGGDNRSRYTEGELRKVVRESDVQIYSIGIFDSYAPTQEEVLGPELLKEICEMTGGRLFNVGGDVNDLQDVATRISAELRNEYVIGYTPSEVKHDGNWRKLKVRLVPPPGPPATDQIHFRPGYYAPSE